MCLLCPCVSDFWKGQGRLKPSDLSLNGLWVEGMVLPKVERPLILTKALTHDETASAFYQRIQELSGFNIFLFCIAREVVFFTAMAARKDKTKSHTVL